MKAKPNQDTHTEKIYLHSIDPRRASIPSPEERVDSRADYVTFGTDNRYPEFLFECYQNCSILQSIINGLSDYICGSGFVNEETNEKPANNKTGETWLELVKKVVADYLNFGAFAVEIIRNLKAEIVEINWVDVRFIRLDEAGDKVYYRKNWEKFGRGQNKVYDRFRRDTINNHCIFYYKNPRSRGLYGLPMWNSVTKDVMTAIEISKFHLSSILNNFAPSAIVNFNNGEPTIEEQRAIEKKLNEKFSGSDNASRMLLSFNSNKEQAVTIERLSEDGFDQKYQALAKSVRDNIFVSFRAQPQLFGTDPERTGFNSLEYQQSFELFQQTVVEPIQREIESAFRRIDPKFSFELKSFNVNFTDNTTTNTELA